MNEIDVEINAPTSKQIIKTANNNNNNNSESAYLASTAMSRDNTSEVDMQSPVEMLNDEPDVVEMMDEDEEDDDDDDDEEEGENANDRQNDNPLFDPHHRRDSTNLLDNNDNLINKSFSVRHSISESVEYAAGNVDADAHQDEQAVVLVSSDADSLENEDRKRFQIELEFVQSLANPSYLNFLAQRGYFKSETFLNYLKYLMYWKKPEYCKYLMYPQCLSLLEMLQHEQFLKEIVNAACSKYIDEQILLIWLHYKTQKDWIRIDPCKIPDNIEKLFAKHGDPEEADTAKSPSFKVKHGQKDTSNNANSTPNDAENHHFHENHVTLASPPPHDKDPFLASFFVANEKFW